MNAESHSKLMDVDWHPSPRKVRQFAVCLAILLVLIAWYGGVFVVALVAAALILIVCWLWPAAFRPLYIAIMLITLPMGMVIGEVALLAIYFGVFLPTGLLFRLVQRDALQRKLDRNAVSYWKDSRSEPLKKSYLRRY